MYKTLRLELRLSAREVEMLDQIRGAMTRSAWIRNQILTHHRAHKTPLHPDILSDD